MSQHTPGPWTIEEGKDSTHIVGENAVLAQVMWWPIMADQTDANAHLIAAAPDLLAALEQAAEWIEEAEQGRTFSATLAKARAAIARAKEERT